MILGFKQHYPWGDPTFFREKILVGVDRLPTVGVAPLPKKEDFNSKIHTMREDKHDRWKAGMSIQMVYRGKNYSILDEFNKGIPELSKCISTQSIILYFSEYAGQTKMVSIYIDGRLYWVGQVTNTGGNSCSREDRKLIETLAINDGFKSSIEFFKWFNKDWTGKIIHWTDLKY